MTILQDSAGDWIAGRRLAGKSLADMPAEIKPATEADAYQAQNRLLARLSAAGKGELVGWKIGVTTPQMRTHLGIETPIAGGMLSSGWLEPAAKVRYQDYCRIGIECEIAMVLGRPLGDHLPVGREAAEAAVERIHPAIEIVDDRYGGDYRGFGVPTIIADCAFHAGFILGEPVQRWRDIDLAAVTGTTAANGKVQVKGIGADVQGHPMASLAWLANRLGSLGKRLEAGHIVLTGSLPLPYWAHAGETVEISIERLGSVSLRID